MSSTEPTHTLKHPLVLPGSIFAIGAAVSVFLWTSGILPGHLVEQAATDSNTPPPNLLAANHCGDTLKRKLDISRPVTVAISGNKAEEHTKQIDDNTYRIQADLDINQRPGEPPKHVPFICKAQQQSDGDWKVLDVSQPDDLTP